MAAYDAFLQNITALLGPRYEIRTIDSSTPGLPPVSCFIYHHMPAPGMTTAVTHGLSLADHPDWRYGKPELIVTVKSADESWGMAAAFFAERYRGEKSFTYGSLFTFTKPICSESEMCGFIVHAPAILDHKALKIELPSTTINLAGMYPIYSGEGELIRQIGLETFWRLPKLDLLDVRRADLSRQD